MKLHLMPVRLHLLIKVDVALGTKDDVHEDIVFEGFEEPFDVVFFGAEPVLGQRAKRGLGVFRRHE